VIVIANFFEGDDVGIQWGKIGMDRFDLPVFFGARSVWAAAREPLDVPEGDGELSWRWGWILRVEREGKQCRDE